MPFSTVGWFESDTIAAIKAVAAINDPKYTVEGDNFKIPTGLNNVVAAYAIAASIDRARLVAPSIEGKGNHEITPVDVAAEPTSLAAFQDLRQTPIVLDEGEELSAEVLGTATAVDHEVFVWLADGPITPVSVAGMQTIRLTGTATLTADAWTNFTPVLSERLEVGRYQVVGFRFVSASAIVARLVFNGQDERPGVIAYDAVGDKDDSAFRYGNMGVFGEFDHDEPPKVEAFAAAGDTSETLFLDVVKIS